LDTAKINKIFCQPLLSSLISSPSLSIEEEDYIWEKCRDNLYSGFINKYVIFNEINVDLQNKLQKLSRNYQYKFFTMYEDMFEISEKFKENNIRVIFMKGMALNLADIQQIDQRHCRDIDILVEKKFLNKAYEILKSIGFSYLNEDCEDESSFLEPMHHLPPLSNSKGTIIELHHRVTSPQAFLKCPLTDIFFENFQSVKGIYIPSSTNLILHALYHGVIHNSLGDGLLFLIDLKKITNKYNVSIDLDLAESLLKINRKTLLKIEEIVSTSSRKNIKPSQIQDLVESLLQSKTLFSHERKQRISISKKLDIFKRLNIIKYEYQVSSFSIKFFRLTFKKIINLVKRNYL